MHIVTHAQTGLLQSLRAAAAVVIGTRWSHLFSLIDVDERGPHHLGHLEHLHMHNS